eukprot:gnl/TRDRNA2_/TRDRNA2_154864_c0_seq1.p1 gnl/TRDRNA2_/TRDRNA2_154864_c0~~gnl/TRDRNA2_/TRDRNA2_154864_c0_seq1.p1  ORF type:complete len:202 (+),score=29.01 gnl/TRDRNA2_/TRDRNA2_154864_c0_seq1:58-663(+)
MQDDVFARRNAAYLTAMIRGEAAVSAGLGIMGFCELLLGDLESRGEAFNKPLRCWLLIDGAAVVAYAALSFVSFWRKSALVGSVELQAYLLRKQRNGGAKEPEWECRSEEMDTETSLEAFLKLSKWIFIPLFLLGCCCYYMGVRDPSCDPSLTYWSAVVLLLKFFAPCLSCCLSTVCGVRAFMRHNPKEGTVWDGMATDMW